MTQIETVNNQKFIFNGIEYYKNFMPKVVGDKIEILNVYDSKIRLTDFPTLYSDIEVDGIVYASVNTTQIALLPVLYTRGSLTGGDSLFLGNFISLAALQAAYPTAPSGSRANIVVSGGQDDLAVWDSGDSEWVVFSGQGGGSVTSVNGYVDEVVLDADDIDDTTTAHKFASEAELEQIATNTTDIVDLKAKKPVANTYANLTTLLADQSNQEIGYLYRVLASSLSYAPAPFGELILELTQTTGSLNDYKLAYAEFKKDLISVIDDGVLYEKAGFYKLDEGSSITIETNAKSFEDDTVYFYEDDYFYVERKLVGNNSDDLPTYRDDYYNSLGIYVGYKIVSEDTVPPPQINLNEVLILDDYFIPNNHYTVDIYDNTKSIKKGKIKKALTEDDLLIQGLLKMPYNSFFRVLKSNLIINGKDVSHEFVFISDSVNETVTPYIRLLSGFNEDNSYLINKTILLDFEFTNEFIYDYENYQPITKDFTTDGSGLIINDISLSHSNDMKTWIQQYINNNLTGTPPTIIGYENSDASIKVGQNPYRLDVMYRNNSDLVCSATTNSFDFFKFNDQNKDIFKIIALGSNTLERLDRTTAEDDFLADCVMVTSRAETDDDGTDPKGSSYGFGVEFNEPTRDADLAANGMTDTQASDNHEQSPATAIVAAKFKWLRNETGAPWGLIREACRATASNAGSYNIYRGFGKIDAFAAKTYIESNIDTWTGVNTTELAEYYDAISPYNTAVKLEEKTDKTPVVKKDLGVNIPNTTATDVFNVSNVSSGTLKYVVRNNIANIHIDCVASGSGVLEICVLPEEIRPLIDRHTGVINSANINVYKVLIGTDGSVTGQINAGRTINIDFSYDLTLA